MRKFLLIAIVPIVGIFIGYLLLKDKYQKQQQELAIINPIDISEKSLVDSSLLRKGFGHTIADFSFTNQFGETITQKDIQGKVVIVDYFFTTCGSICPVMSTKMQQVQAAFLKDNRVVILSHSVWPEQDSVSVLAAYGSKYGAVHGKWHLLTGDKEKLYEQARKSYFLLKPAEAANAGDANSDFIHTNNFVLIDQQKRIRGYFDGTSDKEVKELIAAVNILLGKK